MPGDDKHLAAFEFFAEHFKTGELFTMKEFEDHTNWHGATLTTNWSKWFRPLTYRAGGDKIAMAERFRRYSTWRKFKAYTSQARPFADYREFPSEFVRVYEFFMPLSNEAFLRSALDGLFFEDRICHRLRAIPEDDLIERFYPEGELPGGDYLPHVLKFVSDNFGGYSIYHVSGRFRLQPLKKQEDVGSDIQSYLADETTAVARFIFPCETEKIAKNVDFLFTRLFVDTVLGAMDPEDQVWMVETGYKNRLRVYRDPTKQEEE